MSMHGYLHQISPTRLDELLADPEQVTDELYPSDRDFEPECTVEKTWNAIQFVLQVLSQLGHFPEDSPYLKEGNAIGPDLSYGPAEYRSPQDVSVIADGLAAVDDDMLREAYQPDLMQEYNVYPEVWDAPEQTEWNFEWIREHFRSMVDYYQDAAGRGNAMLEFIG